MMVVVVVEMGEKGRKRKGVDSDEEGVPNRGNSKEFLFPCSERYTHPLCVIGLAVVVHTGSGF